MKFQIQQEFEKGGFSGLRIPLEGSRIKQRAQRSFPKSQEKFSNLRVREWIPTQKKEQRRKTPSPVGTFQTKQPGALTQLLEYIQNHRNQSLSSLCVSGHLSGVLSGEWPHQWTLIHQSGVKTKASMAHTWGPG